ncbi:hypothetical protein L6164_003316 [Bauhinia variegata]|uniref:Uncharacterized protein n=1 Tax=Bauhinia variegata TaxID=167791 RepID=A0ACB9Q0Y4_BAUVA|nr:hypothetical protein L6164_003316 [Bauhinia variegata]
MEGAPTGLITPPPSLLVDVLPRSAAPPRSSGYVGIVTKPPPQFSDSHSSVDLSPLEFLLALVAVVTIPALIYTFIFAVKCPSRRRRPDPISGPPSVASEVSREADVTVSDLKYQKDAHVKELGSECPVCLSVFTDGEEVRQLSACKHSFHATCIDLWLDNHSNCPICRATVSLKRPSSSAPARYNDLQQGLPDASSLV